MTTTITFSVRGSPKGQPRPRAFARGGVARVYDPGTAEGWKGQIALAAQPHVERALPERPVELTICFFFARPKSHHNAKGALKPSAPAYHSQKPDADNLAKAVMDALTTLGFWRDDAQVVALDARKHWGSDALPEGAVVEIQYL